MKLDRNLLKKLNATSRCANLLPVSICIRPHPNPIRRNCNWALLDCERTRPIESLPQVLVWVRMWRLTHDPIAQIVWLSSDMPNPLLISQFKELRNNYLQEKKREEERAARVRYMLNTTICWSTSIRLITVQWKEHPSPIIIPSILLRKIKQRPRVWSDHLRSRNKLSQSFDDFRTWVTLVLLLNLGDGCYWFAPQFPTGVFRITSIITLMSKMPVESHTSLCIAVIDTLHNTTLTHIAHLVTELPIYLFHNYQFSLSLSLSLSTHTHTHTHTDTEGERKKHIHYTRIYSSLKRPTSAISVQRRVSVPFVSS